MPRFRSRLPVDFQVALDRAARGRNDIALMYADEMQIYPINPAARGNPLALRVKLSHQGTQREIGLIPDFAFGLRFHDGSKGCFMVEIDRGTIGDAS